MLNLYLYGSDNVQTILKHQVIVIGDRTSQGIFDRNNAVAALSKAYRTKDIFKLWIELDIWLVEYLQTGTMREGTSNTLAGSLCGGGRILFCTSDNRFNWFHYFPSKIERSQPRIRSINASAAADSMQGTARRTMHGS